MNGMGYLFSFLIARTMMQNKNIPPDRIDKAAGVSAIGALSGNLLVPTVLAVDRANEEESRMNVEKQLTAERAKIRYDVDLLVAKCDAALKGGSIQGGDVEKGLRRLIDGGVVDRQQLILAKESAERNNKGDVLSIINKILNPAAATPPNPAAATPPSPAAAASAPSTKTTARP